MVHCEICPAKTKYKVVESEPTKSRLFQEKSRTSYCGKMETNQKSMNMNVINKRGRRIMKQLDKKK